MRMKAYAVLENDENTGGILFARHAVTARRRGANEFADGDFSSVRCHRAKWADQWAESGNVPASVCIEHGWHFECCGCGATITEDWLDDNGLPVDGVIGTQWSLVFCSPVCRDSHEQHEARRKIEQEAAVAMLRRMVLDRFPGVEFADGRNSAHAYCVEHGGVWIVRQACVSFNFPGMKIGPATLRWDPEGGCGWRQQGPTQPYYSCCNGDKEAFEDWARQERGRE